MVRGYLTVEGDSVTCFVDTTGFDSVPDLSPFLVEACTTKGLRPDDVKWSAELETVTATEVTIRGRLLF